MRDLETENSVRNFYDEKGWKTDSQGISTDAELWEDLRTCAADYVSHCRRKLLDHLPTSGERILDAASGPIQYPEYLEYSKGFKKRVCVDISQNALDQAKKKLGELGEYHCASILELPFPDDHFDAVLSLHTIYHIDKGQQEAAVRQLIRISKPNTKIIIIYANPDRFLALAKRWLMRSSETKPEAGTIYYHAHPLQWWKRFSDQTSVELLPWRTLTAQDSRRLIPSNPIFGKLAFRAIQKLEELFPRLATRYGAYPMVVLTKHSKSR
ncbi:MAG: class I SAM-dependent methyltransferase [Bdellovibrionota bacterium]